MYSFNFSFCKSNNKILCGWHVEECVEYLNLHFNNRVILFKGSSLDVVPLIDRKLGETISLWMARTGGHSSWSKKLLWDAFVVVDDTNNSIEEEYSKYVNDNKIKTRKDLVIEIPPHWPHEIGQIIKE